MLGQDWTNMRQFMEVHLLTPKHGGDCLMYAQETPKTRTNNQQFDPSYNVWSENVGNARGRLYKQKLSASDSPEAILDSRGFLLLRANKSAKAPDIAPLGWELIPLGIALVVSDPCNHGGQKEQTGSRRPESSWKIDLASERSKSDERDVKEPCFQKTDLVQPEYILVERNCCYICIIVYIFFGVQDNQQPKPALSQTKSLRMFFRRIDGGSRWLARLEVRIISNRLSRGCLLCDR